MSCLPIRSGVTLVSAGKSVADPRPKSCRAGPGCSPCVLMEPDEMVGPVGLEPTTKGFTVTAVSGGSGLSLHPQVALLGCGTL